MKTLNEIITYIESTTGHSLNNDEYITFGKQDIKLTGVTVTWMVTPESIKSAADMGHNCIIHHEALTYPHPGFSAGHGKEPKNWQINTQRKKLLAKHGITAIRIHGSADEICIYNAFAEQLVLGKSIADDGSGVYSRKVFNSPVPTFGELIERVKKKMGMSAVRTTKHNANRPVNRIGLPWGGLGLGMNVSYMQKLVDIGVDTFICGEADNFGIRFADEQGIAVIETSHEISETAGLQILTEKLRTALELDVQYVHIPCVWEMR
jgi:putative NIF3 family GTP cyclohydrolase 1 type 2